MSDGHVQYENKKMFFGGPGGEGPTKEQSEQYLKAKYEEDQKRIASLQSEEEREREQHRLNIVMLIEETPFIPLNDRVLVVPSLSELVTTAGQTKEITREDGSKAKLISITGTKKNSKRATNKGTVVSVGPGLILRDGNVVKVTVNPGDIVMYEQFGYSEVSVNDIYCHVVRQEDILGRSK